jgi:tetratricopeptide (TPR) repeat protein
MAKKNKPRKVNVDMPGLEDFEIPAGAPPEAVEAMKLMQKAYTDPEGLNEEEFNAFMDIANALNEAEDAEISPENRKQAAKLGARAFELWQADDLDKAFETANEALDLNPREPTADLVNAVLSIEGDQEQFEAMGAISMQVDFEMRRENDDARVAVLEEVGAIARIQAGVAAFQAGHFESAIGPLAEVFENGSDEDAGTAMLFLVAALIGDDEGQSALDLMEDMPLSHPVFSWARVLARLSIGDPAREEFKIAISEAPRVYEYLTTKPLTDTQREEALKQGDQEAFAAHLFGRVLARRKALHKKLKKLAAT